MSRALDNLAERIDASFAGVLQRVESTCGELTYELDAEQLIEVCAQLQGEEAFAFEQLIDICGVDYPERDERFEVGDVHFDGFVRLQGDQTQTGGCQVLGLIGIGRACHRSISLMAGPDGSDSHSAPVSRITMFSSCTMMRPSPMSTPGSSVSTIPGISTV